MAQKDLSLSVKNVYKAKEDFMAVKELDLVVELEDGKLYVVKKMVTSITMLPRRSLGPALNKATYLPSLTKVNL